MESADSLGSSPAADSDDEAASPALSAADFTRTPAADLRRTWQLRLAVLAAAAAAVMAAAWGWNAVQVALAERPDRIAHALAVARNAEQLRSALPSGDSAEVPESTRLVRIDAAMRLLEPLLVDDLTQRMRLSRIGFALRELRSGQPVLIQAVESLNTQIDELVAAEQAGLRQREAELDQRLRDVASLVLAVVLTAALAQWLISAQGHRIARRALRIAQIRHEDQNAVERLNLDLERRVQQRTVALLDQKAALRLRSDCSLLLIGADTRPMEQVLEEWKHRVRQATNADRIELDLGAQADPRAMIGMLVAPLAQRMGVLRVHGGATGDAPGPLQSVLFEVAADLGMWLDSRRQRELRREAEAEGERMGAQLAALFDQAPLAMAVFDTELRFLRVNLAFTSLADQRPADMAGKRFIEIEDDGLRAMLPVLRQSLASGVPVLGRRFDVTLGARSGKQARLLVSMAPLLSKDHRVFGIALMCVDVTEIEQSRKRQAELSRQLMQVEDAERSALARELHDDVGQQLAAMKISLRMLQRGSADLLNQPLLTDALQVLDECIAQVRQRAMSLRPALLDEMGVEAALRWHAQRQSARYSVPVEVDAALAGVVPRPDWSGNVYRIVQEALRNALQHGQPQQVWIRLWQESGQVVLSVRDDGRGIPLTRERRPDSSGIGLMSMRERVELLGGSFELKAVEPTGTEVRGRWPLAQVQASVQEESKA
ncbi:ATP-binding protein [Piscinibacter terrae]|nr:ATP-binding protein [Albitalea terrae]